MKNYWKKGAIVLFSVALVMVMTSSAMALILTGRSEEMTANSNCDLAGTVTIQFTETDYSLIAGYLDNQNTPKLDDINLTDPRPGVGDANYVMIRATLGGELIDINADEPRLCKDIVGDNSELGASGEELPNHTKVVVLDELNIEVSDICDPTYPPTVPPGEEIEVAGDDWADVTAYVYGKSGQQFFTIYVTDLQPANTWDDERNLPWIKVGLYRLVSEDSDDWENGGADGGADGDGYQTSICADIHDFGTNARLLVSLDIEPTQLTYTTSDNQIGHMLRGNVEVTDCGKDEDCDFEDDSDLIPLCDTGQASCPGYYKCILVEGTYQSSGELFLVVRSNGSTSGANTQEGIYIRDIEAVNEDGADVTFIDFSYFPADGPNNDRSNEWGDDSDEDMTCTWVVEYAEAVLDADLIDGTKVVLCVEYDVNPEHVTRDSDGEILNPTVQFWVNMSSVPCGEVVNDSINAGTLVECGQADNCMYFPYVLQNAADAAVAWTTGVAVTNLSEAVSVEDMVVTVTLTDATGVTYTGELPGSMVTGKVVSFTLDSLIAEMGWEIAAGPAWLEVMGNFMIDGYTFLFSDSGFGAGTLPRLLKYCDMEMRNEYGIQLK